MQLKLINICLNKEKKSKQFIDSLRIIEFTLTGAYQCRWTGGREGCRGTGKHRKAGRILK